MHKENKYHQNSGNEVFEGQSFLGEHPKATLTLPYSACTLQRKQVSLVVSTETQS